ncbi:MAG: glycosyltransferase family 4 protein [Planctomycetaceae bacterium]
MNRPAVLLLSKGYTPDPGGLETYGEDLARSLAQCGLRVHVVTQFAGPRGIRRRGKVLVWNVGPGPQWHVFARMFAACRQLVRRRSFLFSYATTWRVATVALSIAAPRPLGVTIHGREVLVPSGLLAKLMRGVFARVDQVFSVSDFTLQAARARGVLAPSQGIRNWNGISPATLSAERRRPHSAAGTVRLFTICRLVPRKNLGADVRAVGRLIDGDPSLRIHYSIAGDGESREEIQRVADELGLGDRVTLLGRVSDAVRDELYASADVFLHPQIALQDGQDVEGFGLVIAEAMARGLAVLVGRDGGTADFVHPDETGVVVDGNDVGAIANGLAGLVSDADRRRRIAAAGKNWVVQNLSWQSHAEAILQHLDVPLSPAAMPSAAQSMPAQSI